MQFYEKYITSLEKNEVFQFGSNKSGFSGAGSAGFATFNKAGNVWRAEKYDEWPHGKKGCWNVKGISEGFMKGTCGRSYAIPTVTKPGAKKSISIADIKLSIMSFYAFALAEQQLKFFVAQDATPGLNGHSADDMAEAYACMPIPNNIYFYKPFWELVKSKL